MEGLLVLLKALADETRLKIISLLLAHDFCVGALAKRLEISKAAISQHLQLLRKAGLVKGEKKGYWTHYSVQRDVLNQVADKIKELAAQTNPENDNCFKGQSDNKEYCRKGGEKNV